MFKTRFPFMEEAGSGDGGSGNGDAGEGGSGGAGDGGAGSGEGNGAADNWRTPFAGGDDKLATRLERFTQPEDMGKAFFEAQDRIRSGDLLKPLGDKPSDDDLKAYREQQGIPVESAGYLENLPDGLVIGEDDKPIVEDLMAYMHKVNLTPAQAHAQIGWYNAFQEKQTEALAEMDAEHSEALSQELRDEYGADYRINMNVAKALLSELPKEKRAMFEGARMDDGRGLFNDPDVMRWLVKLGRQVNPAQTIIGAGAGDNKTVDARIKEIESKMGTPEYTKDKAIQDELVKLYDVVEHRKAA